MVSETILSFQDSFNRNILNQIINNPNKHPWAPIDNWKATETKEIIALAEISTHSKNKLQLEFQKNYLEHLASLTKETVFIYYELFSGDIMGHDNRVDQLKKISDSIINSTDQIRNFSIQGDHELSYNLKVFCLSKFESIIAILDEIYGINILISPLKNEYNLVSKKLKLFITPEEVQLFSSTKTKQKRISNKKSLLDFFYNIDDKNKFLEDLREVFNTERGIQFKILIELLKEEKILLIGEREFQNFYDCISEFFNRNIGTYTALNDLYKHTDKDKENHIENILIIQDKLNPLLIKHKTK